MTLGGGAADTPATKKAATIAIGNTIAGNIFFEIEIAAVIFVGSRRSRAEAGGRRQRRRLGRLDLPPPNAIVGGGVILGQFWKGQKPFFLIFLPIYFY